MFIRLFLVVLFVSASFAFPTAQTLYWTDIGSHKIQRAAIDGGTGIEDIVTSGVITPVDIAVDRQGGYIYWTEASPGDFMISRANLDGTGAGFLVSGLASPSGIAVDPDGGKLYWTDVGSRKIQRAGLDGTGIEDLVTTGVQTPVDIALDLSAGLMYWTEFEPGEYAVYRANLDGTNAQGIVVSAGGGASGIAVDPAGGKIYWTERTASKIKRANLDGTGEEVIVSQSLIEPVDVALNLSEGHIYWTEASPADFMISRANLDGTGAEFAMTGLTSPSGIAFDDPSNPLPAARKTWGGIKSRFKD